MASPQEIYEALANMVVEMVEEMGFMGIPSSTVYLVFSERGVSANDYMIFENRMVADGKIRRENHRLLPREDSSVVSG